MSSESQQSLGDWPKTVIFIVGGLIVFLVAILMQPGEPETNRQQNIGEELFPEFTDATNATSLEITKYDRATGKPQTFNVARVDGVWSLPSSENYPADAEDQMVEAATGLMGLTVVDLIEDSQSDLAEYGVVDPTSELAGEVDPEDIGTRVVMKSVNKDGEEETLVSLIIGRNVRKDEEDVLIGEDQRYVMKLGENTESAVLVTEVKTEKLSTDFSDWIETDLLKLKSFDITEVTFDDHTVDEARGSFNRNSLVTVAYNDTADPQWTLLNDEVPKQNPATGALQMVNRPLAEGEELDVQKLNDAKSALDDLKIVDVVRKPEGLSADLGVSTDFKKDEEAIVSLMQHGFYPAQLETGEIGIYSNEGETRVMMKDGVVYRLRFGSIAGTGEGNEEGDAGQDVNRYLMVMAEFDEAALEKPVLPPIPEVTAPAETPETPAAPVEGTETPAPAETPAVPAETPAPVETPAPAETPAAPTTPEATTAPTQAPEADAPETPAVEVTPGDTPAVDLPGDPVDPATAPVDPATAPVDPATPPVDPTTVGPPIDPSTLGMPPVDPSAPTTPPATIADPSRPSTPVFTEADIERITQQRQRMIDEYDEKVEEGKKHAAELNRRFANWYYVISEDVYKKIRLTREEVIVPKKPEGMIDGGTPDDFHQGLPGMGGGHPGGFEALRHMQGGGHPGGAPAGHPGGRPQP